MMTMNKVLVLFFTVLCLGLGKAATAMDNEPFFMGNTKDFNITGRTATAIEALKKSAEASILSAENVTDMMDLLKLYNINPTAALLSLINTAHPNGVNLEEKINALIAWHDKNKQDVHFDSPNNIWQIMYGYAYQVRGKIQSLPAWIEWFIKRGPRKQDGSASIASMGSSSPINIAITSNYPEVVTILLNHGQIPSDDQVSYALQKQFTDTLAALPQQQVARVAEQKAMADAIWAQATQWPDNSPVRNYVAALNTDWSTKINAIKNPQNAKMLLLEAAKWQSGPDSINVVGALIKKIDDLDPDKKQVVFNAANGQTLIDLIGSYTVNFYHKPLTQNNALPQWVAWFIERGIPADSLGTYGGTAMMPAIRHSRNDVVTVLLQHGAQTTTQFDSNVTGKLRTYTPIEYAQTLGVPQDILNTLKNPPAVTWRPASGASSATAAAGDWDTFVTSIARGDDNLLLTSPENSAIHKLSYESLNNFKPLVANQNPLILKKIQTALKERNTAPNYSGVKDYDQKIQYLQSLTATKFSLSRLKAGLGIIAAAITANAFYKWFTRKPAQHQEKNIIINKTGAPLFIDGQTIAINGIFALPQQGEVRIKLAQDQDQSKDLVINMDAYTDDLNDSYLNLIIYTKWFSRLFTVPLTTSEVWVDMQEPENKA